MSKVLDSSFIKKITQASSFKGKAPLRQVKARIAFAFPVALCVPFPAN